MPTNQEHYQKYKEYYKEYFKEYHKNNKEHINEQKKEYYKNNQEHKKEYQKEYNQTDAGKKTRIISNWKRRGLIHDDYEALYEKYINTWECENCAIELVTGHTAPNRRCLDHCHITGKFRNILCHCCNIERGKDDNSIK